MKRKNSILYMVIVVLVGLLLFSLTRHTKNNSEVIVKTKIDTLIVQNDTVIYKKRLIPIRIDSIRVDTIVIPEDTTIREAYINLVKAYNLNRHYVDTIYSDSLNHVVLTEDCFMNEIQDRKVNVNIKNKIITKTTTVEKNNYYNGIGIGVISSTNTLIPSIMYSTKNVVYLGGYDIQDKNIRLGVFYKFNFKR